jgi:hypothetical protein
VRFELLFVVGFVVEFGDWRYCVVAEMVFWHFLWGVNPWRRWVNCLPWRAFISLSSQPLRSWFFAFPHHPGQNFWQGYLLKSLNLGAYEKVRWWSPPKTGQGKTSKSEFPSKICHTT